MTVRASSRRVLRRSTVAAAMVSVLVAGQAQAASRSVSTHLVAHVAPATALVGSVITVSGTVSPHAAVPLTLERLVGRTWRPLVARHASGAGAYALPVRVPGAATRWTLRVVRGPAAGVKQGVSARLHVTVTRTAFTVTAAASTPVGAGSPVVVIGTLTPRANGTVTLQALVAGGWQSVAVGAVSGGSTFSVPMVEPPGSYRLRVARDFSTTVAAGASPPVTVVVSPAAPTVTGVLPGATLHQAYTATLTASGGVAPYTWTASGLPPGLGLTSAGVLAGLPTAAGSAPVSVVVTDSAGRTGSAALPLTVARAPGRVWAWGGGTDGQLGNAGMSNSDVIVPVSGLTAVTADAAGGHAGYALLSDGTVWAWGDNLFDELGNSAAGSGSAVPVRVGGLTGVAAVTGNYYDGYALRSDGTVWAWGGAGSGQLGNGANANSVVPVEVTGLTRITAIAADVSGGYALRSDGTVWAWGYGVDGELGNGTEPSFSDVPVQVSGLTGVTAIAGGGYANGGTGYALRSDGTVWAWGYDGDGELGDGLTASSDVPVEVTGLTATAISGGGEGGYALRADGTVWAWGNDAYGQLGNGTSTSSTVPVQVNGLSAVSSIAGGLVNGYALRSDGTVWAWGADAVGGVGDGMTSSTVFDELAVQVGGLNGVTSIAAGSSSPSTYAIETG